MTNFIIGKACADYTQKLKWLDENPLKLPTLNEDAFSNWKVNKHPDKHPVKVYNNGVLEIHIE